MSVKRFGTFEGVFIPSLLSIFGVIMYLRLGWVVGSVGLGGALLIIVLSNIISVTTGLSMSSIVTNIRIGPGGAHSIIAKSLGIEAGGAIGIPLFFSQAISVAFYIAGFSECWVSVFPQHNIVNVSLLVWLVTLIVSYYSAKLAFRIQFAILTVIGLSLLSVFMGRGAATATVPFLKEVSSGHFLVVFAVFFPAVTGILAGASMSGELTEPRKSIPRGTLGAILVSFLVYCVLAFWFASHASAGELVGNTAIVIDMGRWRWLVIAGIMGATLSSALNMFVTSPRTLFALGKNAILPFSSSFVRTNKKGEPRTAILLTALISLITIMCGSLNQVAGLLTMFFLITYAMINLSVFIEQSIGIASFRPSFRVPRIVPFVGSVGCIAVMFLINPVFSIIALLVIVCIYVVLVRRETKLYSPDVRSGILTFIAEQMAKAAARLPYHPKIWKPNLLIPTQNISEFSKVVPFVNSITYPSGRALVFAIIDDEQKKSLFEDATFDMQKFEKYKQELNERLFSNIDPLKENGILVENAVVEAPDFLLGATTVLQTVKGMYFPPNTLFCLLPDIRSRDSVLSQLIKKSASEGLGIVVLRYNSELQFGEQKTINLWIRKGSPNVDLSILMTLQLKKNWEGQVRLLQAISSIDEQRESQSYLSRLRDLARLPADAEIQVLVGEFKDVIGRAPPADINIFGMPEEPDLEAIRDVFDAVKTSVLFLRDSEHESAVA